MFIRGGVWVGAFILGGWVPQNPSDPPPPPLINDVWLASKVPEDKNCRFLLLGEWMGGWGPTAPPPPPPSGSLEFSINLGLKSPPPPLAVKPDMGTASHYI